MRRSDIFNETGHSQEQQATDIEFHLHIPFIVDCAKSVRHSVEFKNYALQALANCSTRDYLKGHIMYHNGV